MRPEEWKDLSVRILILGTPANLGLMIFEMISGFDKLIPEILVPGILIQFALFFTAFMIFTQGADLEENQQEEQRIRDLEDRIKTLENNVFLQEEDKN